MTLFERARALKGKVEALQEAQRAGARAAAYTLRRQRLREVGDQLATHVGSLQVLVKEGELDPSELPDVGPALASWEAVQARHRGGEPDSLVEGRDWSQLIQRGSKVAKNAGARLEGAWSQAVEKRLAGYGRHVLSLKDVPGFREKVAEVQRRQLELRRTPLPRSEAEYETFRAAAEVFRRLLGQLLETSVPAPVLKFFRAAGDRGARLELLTDEVVDWLKEHGIAKNVRITVALEAEDSDSGVGRDDDHGELT